MSHTQGGYSLSVHRIEALSDGIYAVAMTLLVIDLKLPAEELIHGNVELINAVAQLFPKFLSWIISFFVLAMFWYGHHRTFSQVRHVNGALAALMISQLAFVSLMPFCSSQKMPTGAPKSLALVLSLTRPSLNLGVVVTIMITGTVIVTP